MQRTSLNKRQSRGVGRSRPRPVAARPRRGGTLSVCHPVTQSEMDLETAGEATFPALRDGRPEDQQRNSPLLTFGRRAHRSRESFSWAGASRQFEHVYTGVSAACPLADESSCRMRLQFASRADSERRLPRPARSYLGSDAACAIGPTHAERPRAAAWTHLQERPDLPLSVRAARVKSDNRLEDAVD
ncbi:hypothetical protein MRX96_016888 [Rhipicephalus microplus]